MRLSSSVAVRGYSNRNFVVSVRSEANKSSEKKVLPLLNTEIARQRNATIKENINKLIAIASKEVKEFNELMKELDVEHKKALKFININGDKEDTHQSCDPSSNGYESDDEDNIFITDKTKF